jgi:4-amino-4-deoxy-L-arabinose transferase-like glycosyltransferase
VRPDQDGASLARGWSVPAGLVGLALALRLPGVLGHAFDQDELYTLEESLDLFATQHVPGIDARPVYYLLQHALLPLVPHTELGLRLLPLAFGLAGVFLTWYVATRLAGSVAGVVSGLIVAAAPWHMYVSSTARYYSLVYLLALGFFYCFLRAAESGSDRRWHLGAVALLATGSATHPSFVFPAFGGAALVVLAAWTWKRLDGVATGPLITRIAVPFAVFLVVAFAVLKSVGRETAVRNLDGRGWTAVVRLVPAIIEWVTPMMLVAGVVASLWLLWRARHGTDLVWALLAIGGTTGAMVILFFAAMVTNVYPYYATAMLPLLFVVIGVGIARGVEELPGGTRFAGAGALTLVLLAGMAPGTASQILHGTRFDYRPAFDEIRARGPDELVLSWPIVVQRYYAPEFNSREFHPDPVFLQETLDEGEAFWAIASRRRHGIIGDEADQARLWLSRECSETRIFQGRRFDFRMYEVILYRCGDT